MQLNNTGRPSRNFRTRLPFFFSGALLFLLNNAAFADTVVIDSNKVIDKATTYKNVTLDLTHGEFTVKSSGVLNIEDSIVDVVISPSNPFFVALDGGTLKLKNSTVRVTTSGISPNPSSQALYKLINIKEGWVSINKNDFSIDIAYTVGFLSTNPSFETQQFNIQDNMIKNFHGGIYLLNSHNAEINRNNFERVSFTNIFSMGNLNEHEANIFSFPGNLATGDAIDIVNSEGASVLGNVITSSANYGIAVMGSKNIFMDDNKITDGLSYGIFITTFSALDKKSNLYKQAQAFKLPHLNNSNITVHNNYLALNRYGLAANTVNILKVEGNIFIQRFNDNASRQFWTNNSNLLNSVTNLTWLNNVYKEGFTQDNEGDNHLSLQFVTFPADGGVSL